MTTTPTLGQTQSLNVKPEAQVAEGKDKYSKWEVNWNSSKSYMNAISNAQTGIGYYAQMTAYKVAAVVIGAFESIRNVFLSIGNQFIGLANATNRYFTKDKQAEKEESSTSAPKELAQVDQKEVVAQVAKEEVIAQASQEHKEAEAVQPRKQRKVIATVQPEPNAVRAAATAVLNAFGSIPTYQITTTYLI